MKYLEVIKKDCSLEDCPDTKLAQKLLDRSWATREFEIELYWKRAIYFWGFTAALGAAFMTSMNPKYIYPDWLKCILCSIGYIFSLAWYRSSQGSKFWQENWEAHVDMIEAHVHGKLYQTVVRQKDAKGPFECAPYSVSKINHAICLVVSWAWLGAGINVVLAGYQKTPNPESLIYPFDGAMFSLPGLAILIAGLWALERCRYKYKFTKQFSGDEGYEYHSRGKHSRHET